MKKLSLLIVTVFCFLACALPGQVQAQPTGSRPVGGAAGGGGGSQIGNPADNLTQETIDSFNPLVQFGDASLAQDLSTPGGIISRLLLFAFPIAGMILFIMLVWSGLEILAGATEKKSLDAGKNRATAAVVGFILLFASYWLVQLIEVIFGIQVF